MHNDFVPEEEAPEYRQLLTTLRASAQQRAPISSEEQTHMLARVRERFVQTTSEPVLSEVGGFTPPRLSKLHRSSRPTRAFSRLAANLLAALVVIGLILGSWALFKVRPLIPVTSPAVPVSGPSVTTQAHGLEASMHILISGPYFLGELLPIDVALTNHTSQAVGIGGSVRIVDNGFVDACSPFLLRVHIAKGSQPSYAFPDFAFGCFQPYVVTQVAPSQTITVHQYLPLTMSNEVTLMTGIPLSGQPTDPLNRAWPTVHMQIQVGPQIPLDRQLSLQQQNGQVMISTPAGTQVHLLVMQTITCDHYESGSNEWTPLVTNVLHEPTCPTANPHWVYAVSAPGYSIVSGDQTN